MTSEFSSGLFKVCQFVTELRWEDLPASVQQRAITVVCDDLAAIIAGSHEPELTQYAQLLQQQDSGNEALLITADLPAVSRLSAASWNALAGNWCELDEGFRLAICHAGIYTLPALLSEATANPEYTLQQVLCSLAGAYELVTRCAMSFHLMPPKIHGHALWSAVGATAAICLLRGENANTLYSAVTAAITTASMGPRSHLMSGVLIRNGWAAAGAVNGMQCADWAICGIAGSDTSMESVCVDIMGATLKPDEVTHQLGERWSLSYGYQKLFSCCQHGHSAVQAALECQEKHNVDLETIKAIEVETHPLALTLDTVHPETTLGARFSLPHMIAAALIYRSGGAAAFSASALNDPNVAKLRTLVTLSLSNTPLTPPHDRPAWLRVHLNDGQILESHCLSAIGSPDNPVSTKQFQEKLTELVKDVLPGLAQAFVPTVWRSQLELPFVQWLKELTI